MLEIPESQHLAEQFNQYLMGKTIVRVKANSSPHRFAWYNGNPDDYDELLTGKKITESVRRGGMAVLGVEDCRIALSDGATPRWYEDRHQTPGKHQLYIEFDDDSALVCTVQMYGGLCAFVDGQYDNPYYLVAGSKPDPLSDEFTYAYFETLRTEQTENKSAKAFLATEQRIPGLGNGVLQDILYLAKIHPKRRMCDVSEEEFRNLYETVRSTLQEMVSQGGRDTESDLFGKHGGYMSYLCKKTYLTPCPFCGYEIRKANYMGGTIYFCEHCQK